MRWLLLLLSLSVTTAQADDDPYLRCVHDEIAQCESVDQTRRVLCGHDEPCLEGVLRETLTCLHHVPERCTRGAGKEPQG